jgi:hypothetical protein
VNADVQNSQNQIQWQLFSGSAGGQAMATDDFFCARLDGMVDPRHPKSCPRLPPLQRSHIDPGGLAGQA